MYNIKFTVLIICVYFSDIKYIHNIALRSLPFIFITLHCIKQTSYPFNNYSLFLLPQLLAIIIPLSASMILFKACKPVCVSRSNS